MLLSVELLKDNYETLFFSVIVGVGLTAGKNSTFPTFTRKVNRPGEKTYGPVE